MSAKLLAVVLLAALPIALVTVILIKRPALYQGKSEAMWFDEMKGDTNLEALNALRAMGRPAVELLRAELKDPSRDKRFRAAWALWHFGTGAYEAVPDLVQAVDDPDASVREFATLALTQLGPTNEDLARKVVPRLAGPSSAVSTAAANLLDSIEKERAKRNLPPIVRDEYAYGMAFLKSPVPAIRLRGGQKLARLYPEDERATLALKALANDTNGWVRQEVAVLLARSRTSIHTNGAK
jgi:HEAT repeat protein